MPLVPDSTETDRLLLQARAGDRDALGDLIARHSPRLRRMVRYRLDRRLAARVDDGDVIQDVSLEAIRRFREYLEQASMPFFVWLRFLTQQRLAALCRHHLGVGARDPRREVHLEAASSPSALPLAARLVGDYTSPSSVAQRDERRLRLADVLARMDPLDREVLVLRHFEQLGNLEIAHELGLTESAASKRYVRALERLRSMLDGQPT